MTVGTVKEIKKHEYRVGLTPHCVKSYIQHGHKVLVEKGAGEGAGFDDEEYVREGAVLVETAKAVFEQADMIVKVKEPQKTEYEMLREDQILYTYLHLAADKPQTEGLLKSGAKCVAYETMEKEDGTLPCLKPMSEIAGRLSIQEGAKFLEKPFGGRGVLLGGVPGVARGKVAILGGGVVGTNAAQIAMGMGAEVTILDINSARLEYLDHLYMGRLNTLYSTPANIEKVARESDLIIGAVLIPGARAPHLLKKEHLKMMKKGSVVVDVAIDQGGCFETSRATTHDDPVFTVEEVVHYCVANMPGAVSRTSTLALTSTTLKPGLLLADKGVEQACRESILIRRGLNIYKGNCTFPDVAEAFGLPYTPVEEVI
ncbi:MAG: alanine dehydrogenase [Spirochaetales bacterium]|nr:alanine dehydrogenase [Spirochaetales bacterium]